MKKSIKKEVKSIIPTLSFMCDSTIIDSGSARRAIMEVTGDYEASHNIYGRSKGVEPQGEPVNPEFMAMCLEHANSYSNRFGKE